MRRSIWLADSEGNHDEAAAATLEEQLTVEAAHDDVGKEEQRSSSTSETSTSNMIAEFRRVLLDAEVTAKYRLEQKDPASGGKKVSRFHRFLGSASSAYLTPLYDDLVSLTWAQFGAKPGVSMTVEALESYLAHLLDSGASGWIWQKNKTVLAYVSAARGRVKEMQTFDYCWGGVLGGPCTEWRSHYGA
eukprot:1347951-Amphidinium_carterae.1